MKILTIEDTSIFKTLDFRHPSYMSVVQVFPLTVVEGLKHEEMRCPRDHVTLYLMNGMKIPI